MAPGVTARCDVLRDHPWVMSKRTAFSRVSAAALYPVVLVGGCGLAAALLDAGFGEAATSVATLVVVVAVLTLFEHLLPYADAWRPDARRVRIDLLHSLVSAGVASPLVRISSVAFAAWLGGALSTWLGGNLWPSAWPRVAQLALAVVTADLGVYCAHRWMHSSDLGWRIHAVHHTPTRLYVFAGGRSHPFNAVLTLTCEAVPVILLGIPPEVYVLLLVFKAVNGMLQHANIAMTPGPLSYVIATSDVHRFHHATDLAESNTNFGNATVLWDHLFGTFHLPHRHPSSDVGIADADVPESYWAHLLTPFILGRFTRAPVEPASTVEPLASSLEPPH
jgi:sterol desaturase/sphingolipid hydroxylase (fatty acid hydroxylase superfamily)